MATTNTNTSDTGTVELVITKPQVAIMAKKGDNIIDQGGNSYSMNALMLLGCTFLDHVISKNKANGNPNVPYLLKPSL